MPPKRQSQLNDNQDSDEELDAWLSELAPPDEQADLERNDVAPPHIRVRRAREPDIPHPALRRPPPKIARRAPARTEQQRPPLTQPAARQPQQNPQGRIRHANGRLIRANAWVVTLRTGVPPDGSQLVGRGYPPLLYLCGQMERGVAPGPGQSGLHFQGYMEFADRVSAIHIMEVTGWPPGLTHLEPRWGSQEEAIRYTKKEDTAEEEYELDGQLRDGSWRQWGTPSRTPTTLWDNVQEFIQGDGDYEDLIGSDAAHFRVGVQYANGINRMIQARDEQKAATQQERDVYVVLYYGEPRTGKTGTVYRRHGFTHVFKKGLANAQGYTGYKKQEVLLLDEFGQSDNPMTAAEAQQIMDPYPMKLNIKYGQAYAHWNVVYVCTNIPMEQWFPKAAPAVRQSIKERVKEVWHFTKTQIRLERGEGRYPPLPDPKINPPPEIVDDREGDEHEPRPLPRENAVNDNDINTLLETLKKIKSQNPDVLNTVMAEL